jgi:hypothetical protein
MDPSQKDSVKNAKQFAKIVFPKNGASTFHFHFSFKISDLRIRKE